MIAVCRWRYDPSKGIRANQNLFSSAEACCFRLVHNIILRDEAHNRLVVLIVACQRLRWRMKP